MPSNEWELISREQIDFAPGENTFGLKIFKEHHRKAGTQKERTYWKYGKPDVVMIAGFTTDMLLIAHEEFQPGVGETYLKLPGGNVDEGDTPEIAANRELEEETGYRARRMELISTIAHDSGRSEAKVFCYFAIGCEEIGVPEEGSTVQLFKPLEFWDRLLKDLTTDPNLLRGGGNTLKCAATVLYKLGYL
jgi:8-oxo-dGTP pyrophosphatase MutT (NUDIX family)